MEMTFPALWYNASTEERRYSVARWMPVTWPLSI